MELRKLVCPDAPYRITVFSGQGSAQLLPTPCPGLIPNGSRGFARLNFDLRCLKRYEGSGGYGCYGGYGGGYGGYGGYGGLEVEEAKEVGGTVP